MRADDLAMLDPAAAPTSSPLARFSLRGRDREHAVIADALSTAAAGASSTVVIDGGAGAGRSRLLQEAPLLARRLGVRIGDVGTCDAGPTAIIVDDAHLLGSDGLSALAQARRRLAGAPVAWLVSLRRPLAGPELRALVARVEGGARETVALGALDDRAVAQIAYDRSGGMPGPALRALLERADGNPRLVVALLDGAVAEGRLRAGADAVELVDGEPPRAVSALARERLAELRADTARVVRVAAALGPSFSAAQIGHMLDCTPAQLIEPIDDAIRADLLTECGTRLGFRHELLREGLLRSLPESMRRGLRRQAAEILLRCGLCDADIADQLADGAEPGDAMMATRVMDAARGLGPSDAQRAAVLARRAIDICPPGADVRPRLVPDAIALLRAAGRHAEAEEVGVQTLERPLTAGDEAEVRLRLSMLDAQPRGIGRVEHNLRALEECAPPPATRARHLGWLALNLARAGRMDAVPAAAERALSAALACDDLPGRAVATLAAAAVDVDRLEFAAPLGALEALPRLGSTADELECSGLVELTRVQLLSALGRMAEATQIARQEHASAQRNNQPWAAAGWRMSAAGVDVMAGRCHDVERWLAAPGDHAGAGLTEHAVRLMLARHRGDGATLRRVGEIARGALDGSLEMTRTRHLGHWLVGLSELAAGDADSAASAMHGALAGVPLDPCWLVDAARAASAVDDRPLGRRVLALTERWLADGRAAVLTALAWHVRALVDGDAEALQRACRLACATERPLVAAAALEDRGEALLRAGRASDGREQLRRACRLFVTAQATGDARRVTDRLAAAGVRRAYRLRQAKGWDALTVAELRVIRLVGAGATNREAAERLVLSPHTVSSHLRSSFAKLDINSRVELARLLLQRDGG